MNLNTKTKFKITLFCCFLLKICFVKGHEAKDFDDSICYKIDFDMPDFEKTPDLQKHVRTFYTHEQEKYDCVIPIVDERRDELQSNEPELSPITLLQPIFAATSCSYRIEAYWSYEICHGLHVRQFHEEREGKIVKFQEYYLGKWNEEKTEQISKKWEEDRKAGVKYKTTKIDNVKYPYFELEMSDGTMCDIIEAPRTTIVRYVCYPHGKNEIYSFKETSSCNYEATILTSQLCVIPGFHPEVSEEVSIKCYNSPSEPHKPLSMLRQELNDLQLDDEFIARAIAGGERFKLLHKFPEQIDKKVFLELISAIGVDATTGGQIGINSGAAGETLMDKASAIAVDLSPIKEFISGKNCLTGGTGWWKYEFCYGRHVRQFHKDKKSEAELFLGYWSETAHRQWVDLNPEKGARRPGYASSIWHHYEKGSRCDRTGLLREVDVKLTCTQITNSASTLAMYLLEPKTCQYVLVVESPIICDLIKIADEYGLVQDDKLQELLSNKNPNYAATAKSMTDNLLSEEKNDNNNKMDPTGATGTVTAEAQQTFENVRV